MKGAARERRRAAALLGGFLASISIATPAAGACHAFSFTQDSYTVSESAGTLAVNVTRDGAAADSSVRYETVDGTAGTPKDYKKAMGRLEFSGSELEKQFEISIVDDGDVEGNETLTLVLVDGEGCTSPGYEYDTATVTIEDDDESPPSPTPSPTPTKTAAPRPTPTRTTPSPSPSASPTPTSPSPSPTETVSPVARPLTEDDGRLSGGAAAGIVATTLGLGGAAAFWVRRRFLV